MGGCDAPSGELERAFRRADRPDLALLLNHGYTGPESPAGGAPDTGGIQTYVQSLAASLSRLGYRVTVFTRGGFPHFDGARLRRETEYLEPCVRFVYVPGGGDAFLRKEDMAQALDEQLAWLDRFVRAEAAERGCPPWEVYALWNSHFWDGAVLGLGLTERWRDDVAAEALGRLLQGVVPDEELERVRAGRHALALGLEWEHHLGRLLLELEGSPATPVASRVRASASRWAAVRGLKRRQAAAVLAAVDHALHRAGRELAPALQPLLAADALGQAVLEHSPEVAAWAAAAFARVDRHAWTPHALAALEEDGQAGRRELRLCERRCHERLVVSRTRAFAATSPALAERLRSHLGAPAAGLFYFPPCVDRARFRPHSAAEMAPALRYLAGLSGVSAGALGRAKLVFETSRMDPTKRKDLLLDAFARVAEATRGEPWRAYLFIGGGPENEVAQALRRQIASHAALRGRAFLTGFIPEEHLAPLFSLAAVYASPAEVEDFGMTVSQAAASGCAVVCSDLIPFPRQYAPADAIILPAGDVDDWVQALRRLLDDDRDRAARALRLQERVKVLDWDAQTRAFLAHLGRLGMDIPPGRP
ncbi:MAG TPA: glycosyltransferase [Myxococcota bacterium]|nr:glycosyltransferase [Myxococcota bacterium]HRY96807.1 glycosyltransferase [Myxococcota bacterium]HSA21835.1 glycosyltransferase [Myxococcota bacterium]